MSEEERYNAILIAMARAYLATFPRVSPDYDVAQHYRGFGAPHDITRGEIVAAWERFIKEREQEQEAGE